ncbi:MAG: hypothetical protein WBE78_11910 [Candidatus Binataceae bacterium]
MSFAKRAQRVVRDLSGKAAVTQQHEKFDHDAGHAEDRDLVGEMRVWVYELRQNRGEENQRLRIRRLQNEPIREHPPRGYRRAFFDTHRECGRLAEEGAQSKVYEVNGIDPFHHQEQIKRSHQNRAETGRRQDEVAAICRKDTERCP